MTCRAIFQSTVEPTAPSAAAALDAATDQCVLLQMNADVTDALDGTAANDVGDVHVSVPATARGLQLLAAFIDASDVDGAGDGAQAVEAGDGRDDECDAVLPVDGRTTAFINDVVLEGGGMPRGSPALAELMVAADFVCHEHLRDSLARYVARALSGATAEEVRGWVTGGDATDDIDVATRDAAVALSHRMRFE
jgi:hypothetical protein